jgi:sterol desaturase/sphingolipid hydroxylase (fatty acid hydroxylase superfamily)
VVATLLALTLFVADDFARYLGHWLEHRVPALWELHKVHHSAEVLNFITAERHHPLSLVFFALLSAAVIVPVNAIFLFAFPGVLSPLALFGANAFWVVANLAGGALRHSPVWLSFGPHVERWIISPAQHQIHHSTDRRHFDRNFGGTLAIWDRMFGTLYVTRREREHIAFGLGAETKGYQSFFALYWRPPVRIVGGLLNAVRSKGLA